MTCKEKIEKKGICTDCDSFCESAKTRKEHNEIFEKYGFNLSEIEICLSMSENN